MTIEGVDYAFARPDPRKLYSEGKRFAGRYVGAGSAGKRLTPAEARSLAGAGLSIVTLVEGAEKTPLQGARVGTMHAASALAEATQCGMPRGYPYFFGVDWNATTAELEIVAEYFRGAAKVLYGNEIGAYAGISQLDWLFRHGLIQWGFQTYAWSDGRWHPRAVLHQYKNRVIVVGAEVDLCRAVTAEYGGWLPGQPDRPLIGEKMPTVEEIWSADLIPVPGDPKNLTWRAKNAMGETLHLVRQTLAQVSTARAELASARDEIGRLNTQVTAAVSEILMRLERVESRATATAEDIAREIIRQMREDPAK